MPRNPETGKTDRRPLPKAEIEQFRRSQAKERKAGVKRGKRRARGSPDKAESEGSGLSASPLAGLSGLGTLALDSGGSRSSAANTPADSPAIFTQPPLPERPSPAPPSAPEIHDASKPSGKSASKSPLAAPAQYSTGVTVEVAGTSPGPAHLQAFAFRGDASPASDDAGTAARIARLESRLNEIEKWADRFEGRLKLLES